MLLNYVFGVLALLSLGLTCWQWLVARRFPLHRRTNKVPRCPGLSLLKPLKGCDEMTERCLRSWLAQEYPGPVQILFAVASENDPVCSLVRSVLEQFPKANAKLVICGPLAGANLKVSKLMQLEPLALYEVLVISDADVKVPPDFLTNVVAYLDEPDVGLVNCFYQLSNAHTSAMQWEQVAINSDFWSQVLQSQSLKPLDFALGAVMAVRLAHVKKIGGFGSLADCLADDYQLGHRIARLGCRIVLCPVVVECLSGPMTWKAVWKHQLRWARTIRVCQPVPYFFSVLSNATIWPVLFAIFVQRPFAFVFAGACIVLRIVSAMDLQKKLTRRPAGFAFALMVPVKDLLQIAVWFLAFLGNRIEWRGEQMTLRRDGTLVRR